MGSETSFSFASGLSARSGFAMGRRPHPESEGFAPRAILAPLLQSGSDSLPAVLRGELDSLVQERNPEMFFEGLIALGRRQSQAGQGELAGAIFSLVTETLAHEFPGRPSTHGVLNARAQRELDALLGRGAVGMRFETLTRNLAREATHPVALASMAMAGLAFSTVRAGVLSRLLASPTRSFFTTGFGARAAATTIGFVGENLAFVYTGRALHQAMGVRQDWSLAAQGRDLAGSALVLGALKLSGHASQGVFNRLHGIRPGAALALTPRMDFTRRIFNQGGMFLGILGGHHAEAMVGLRPHQDGATTVTDAFATLIQFNVAGRLINGAMGPRFAGLQHELHQRSELLDHRSSESRAPRPPLADLIHGWFRPEMVPANSGPGRLAERPAREELFSNNILMAASKGEGGGRRTRRGAKTPSSSEPPPTSSSSRRTKQAAASAGVTAEPAQAPEETAALEEGQTVVGQIPLAELEAAAARHAKEDAVTLVRPPAPPVPETREELGRAETELGAIPSAPLPREVAAGQGTQFLTGMTQARLVQDPSLSPPGQTQWRPQAFLGARNRYQLVRMIGEGGQGDVWEAMDTQLKRTVAIKRLRPPPGITNPDTIRQIMHQLMQRAQRETVIAANLEDRFVVPVYDQIEIEPDYFVPVMKFVPGWDLSDVLRGRRDGDAFFLQNFPPERLLEIAGKLAEAVQSMHERGISHRDLKPDNTRIGEDGNVYLMDFGLAKREGDGNGSGARMSIPASDIAGANLTQEGVWQGTHGYIAPETMLGPEKLLELFGSSRVENFRSPDIFALGVILYEMMTGVHPFATYRDGGEGEPRRVPRRSKDIGLTIISPAATLLFADPKTRQQFTPPSLGEVFLGEQPAFFSELEQVARRAFAPNPADRFNTSLKLQQALLLTPALAEFERIQIIRQGMTKFENEMHDAFDNFNFHTVIAPEIWERLMEPINELIHRRAAWHQSFENLVSLVIRSTRGQPWPEARKLIAKASWERLTDGGNRMDQTIRQLMRQRILENDVPTLEEPLPSMSRALSEGVQIQITPHEIHSTRPVGERLTIKIFPFLREPSSNGKEKGNFREAPAIIDGPWKEVRNQISLPAGYYVFEVNHPNYAPMRVPVEINLMDVERGISQSSGFSLDLEFIPKEKVAPGMVVIQKGWATIGHDFYHDGLPTNLYSRPQRKRYFPTFAISRDPITVGEFHEFIESELNRGNHNARFSIPRVKLKPKEDIMVSAEEISSEPNQPRKTDLIYEFLKVRKEEGLAGALQFIRSKLTGTAFFWNFRPKGRGRNQRYFIDNPFTDLEELARFRQDPSPNKELRTHIDPMGDPIIREQPISNIDYPAAEAFIPWRSVRDGFLYRMVMHDEKEKVDRGSLPLVYPWGYDFNPNFLNSRNIFSNDDDRFIRPVGGHILGSEWYRDFSLYGTRDNLGNSREFTFSPKTSIYFTASGGSVFVQFGPFYFPSSRPVLRKQDVEIGVGAFRLVQDFLPTQG